MASGKRQTGLVASLAALVAVCTLMTSFASEAAEGKSLWPVYELALKGAKYVDLTHTITPNIPVWAGFADSTFAPARAGSDTEGFAKKGDVYTHEKHGFGATEMRSAQISSARSSTRPPIGRRNIRRSTSCRRPTPSGRSWSSRSSIR